MGSHCRVIQIPNANYWTSTASRIFNYSAVLNFTFQDPKRLEAYLAMLAARGDWMKVMVAFEKYVELSVQCSYDKY